MQRIKVPGGFATWKSLRTAVHEGLGPESRRRANGTLERDEILFSEITRWLEGRGLTRREAWNAGVELLDRGR